MRDFEKVVEMPDSAPNVFDNVITFLLGGLLLLMPYAFGVVHSWSREAVVIISSLIFMFFLLRIFSGNQRIFWNWTYVPVILFLFIIIFQLIPLPTTIVKIISPNTVALKTKLLSGISGSEEPLRFMSLSLYPHATTGDLRIVMSLTAVFFVVLNLYYKPKQIKTLLLLIAIIGGSIAIITLGQQVIGNGKIFWFIASKNTNGNSGPFVCHSHYGQFMNLSIGAAIGWLCVTFHEKFGHKKIRPEDILNYFSSKSARGVWVLIAVISVGAATVFVSLTRGGMVSMLAAAIFTTLMIVSRKSLASSGWIMVLIALAAFGCILYIGFDAVYDRFATIGSLDSYSTRFQIIKDLTASFGKYPIFGTGLGTHSTVYPMFQTIKTNLLFTHAENEYVQLIEEMGFLGLMVLAIFGFLVWRAYFKNIRKGKSHINVAAYGLGFGLFAILVHSLSDFGQHLPANAFLSVIFCGLLIGMAQKKDCAKVNIRTKPVIFNIFIFLIFFGVCFWICADADNARLAQSHWNKAISIEQDLIKKDWQGTEGEFEDLIANASKAIEYEPQNAKYRYWYNVYRWYSVIKTTIPDEIDGDVFTEESLPIIQDIVAELNKTIVCCPTFGPAYSLLGRIETYIFYDEGGAEKIMTGYHLAPCDAIACLEAGRLDVIRGNGEASIEKFQKAVEIDGGVFKEVIDIYINYLSRPDLAIEAAGDDLSRLQYVRQILSDMQYIDLADELLIRQQKILEKKCAQLNTTAREIEWLADIYKIQGENEKAIEYYRQALNVDYGKIGSRYKLATLLASNNQIDEAMREARICVRLRPQYNAAKRLIEELSVNPAGYSKKQ